MVTKNSVPTTYIWRKGGLYLGATCVPVRSLKISSDQLVVCLEGEIVTTREDGSEFSSRSFLLKAGTRTNISTFDSSTAVLAVYYISSVSQEYFLLESLMGGKNEEIYYDVENEDQIIETFVKLRDETFSAEEAFSKVKEVLIPASIRETTIKNFDSRIVTVIRRIEETAELNLSVRQLADEVCLSESRLVKLFKSEIGIPITRYRLRHRTAIGAVYMAMGRSVTEAALLSGFSSTAHFSKCFVAIMGLQPSTVFLRPPYLNIVMAVDRFKVPDDK